MNTSSEVAFGAQMDKAKLEKHLVPQGTNVVRHLSELSLPSQGKSLEWILSEVDKMRAGLPP